MHQYQVCVDHTHINSLVDRESLRKLIGGKVVWLEPDSNLIDRYGDGGVAIIDQWIAAHSRYMLMLSHVSHMTSQDYLWVLPNQRFHIV